jgi:hypothetical protein
MKIGHLALIAGGGSLAASTVVSTYLGAKTYPDAQRFDEKFGTKRADVLGDAAFGGIVGGAVLAIGGVVVGGNSITRTWQRNGLMTGAVGAGIALGTVAGLTARSTAVKWMVPPSEKPRVPVPK